jgi:hypothetical protein
LNKQPLFLKQGYTIHPLFETIDALQIAKAEQQTTATGMVDMINKCPTYEVFAFAMKDAGKEFNPDEAQAMFTAKEKKAEEQLAQQQANMLEQQEARGPVGQGGFAVSKPKPKELAAGKAMEADHEHSGISGGGVHHSVDASGVVVDESGGRADSVLEQTKGVERAQFKRWAAKRPESEWGGFVFKVLDEDEQAELVKKKNSKSVDAVARQFCARLHKIIRDAWKGQGGDLNNALRELIEYHISAAYFEGLEAGGIPPEEHDADMAQEADTLVFEQFAHVDGLVAAIEEAQQDEAKRDAVEQRAELWCRSVESAGLAGLNRAKATEMVEWRVGPTEHCDTCAKLDGQKHRRKWFTERNYIPRQAGAAMDCGGFNCQCELVPVKKG